MKKLIIRKHPSPNTDDLQVGWDFGDGNIITFGAIPKDTDLDKFAKNLRQQQLSIGNDDFTIEDRRFYEIPT